MHYPMKLCLRRCKSTNTAHSNKAASYRVALYRGSLRSKPQLWKPSDREHIREVSKQGPAGRCKNFIVTLQCICRRHESARGRIEYKRRRKETFAAVRGRINCSWTKRSHYSMHGGMQYCLIARISRARCASLHILTRTC